jgi:hypothetical protein
LLPFVHYDDYLIQDLHDFDLESVASYDRLVFPAPRLSFLRSWISQPATIALGCKHQREKATPTTDDPITPTNGNTNDRKCQLLGFGVIRPAHDGWRVGPLYADDAAIAETLFCALIERASAAALPDAAAVPSSMGDAIALGEGGPLDHPSSLNDINRSLPSSQEGRFGQAKAGTEQAPPSRERVPSITMDVPAVNPAAMALAARLGLVVSSKLVRMYRGPPPAGLEEHRIFGVTSLELG